jgi:hypothetical protein
LYLPLSYPRPHISPLLYNRNINAQLFQYSGYTPT